MSLFAPRPDRKKVQAIVSALNVDGDDTLSLPEVKSLFGKILQRPSEEIPSDHPEVLELAGLSLKAVEDKLCHVSKAQIDQYYAALFPATPQSGSPGKKADPPTQAPAKGRPAAPSAAAVAAEYNSRSSEAMSEAMAPSSRKSRVPKAQGRQPGRAAAVARESSPDERPSRPAPPRAQASAVVRRLHHRSRDC